MLSLNTLSSVSGARKASRRIGRGNGSGRGTTAGRGMNGQNSRAGGGVPDWFEGGQTPLFRRMPKMKGFSNAIFKKRFNVVNLDDLQKLSEKGITEITEAVLLGNGIVTKKTLPVKLLGRGEISAKVIVTVSAASQSAITAIEKAWGTITLMSTSSEKE